MPKKKRTEFRKRHQGRVRRGDFTREFQTGDQDHLADEIHSERLSGKGDLTRQKTVADPSDDSKPLKSGRVLSAHGLKCYVIGDDGLTYTCAVRQVLKSLSINGRTAVVAGDVVEFRAEDPQDGMIQNVAQRRGIISRTSRGQQHVLAANIDYLLIIASVAMPGIKPALIDRFLLTAAQCNVQPIIVFNKADLINVADFMPMLGTYSTMGYPVLLTSATTGLNIDYLRAILDGKQTALAGQSGVGKSSLLNAVQPGLGLAVGRVSDDNQKGRHTTTATRMIPLSQFTDNANGGAVFDTPGIRQFQLWDIGSSEVAGWMPDFRPFIDGCRYADCLHLQEEFCSVKDAVADGRINDRRYDTYCHLLQNDLLLEE